MIYLKWFTLIILFVIILAGNYFVSMALVRDNRNFRNEDNTSPKKQSTHDIIRKEHNNIRDAYWESEFAKDTFLNFNKEKLYARVFTPHPTQHKWLLAVHGYRSTGKNDMGFVAAQFSEQGFNTLIPDLCSHGKSSGKYIGMGWLNRLEILAWIDELLKIDPEAEIVLFGGSMGAATIMMTSGEPLPKNVKGFIADCGYSTVMQQFESVLEKNYHLPGFPLLTVGNIIAKVRAGYFLSEASCINQLQKNRLPALFIHGTGDNFVPAWMIEKNYTASKGYKEKLIVPDAPHFESMVYAQDEYFEKVFHFVDKHLIP